MRILVITPMVEAADAILTATANVAHTVSKAADTASNALDAIQPAISAVHNYSRQLNDDAARAAINSRNQLVHDIQADIDAGKFPAGTKLEDVIAEYHLN